MIEDILPELATASLMHGLVTLVTTIALVINWHANRHIPGTLDFAICAASNTAGFILLAVFQYTGHYWLQGPANLLILVSFLATWNGIRLFLHRNALPIKLLLSILIVAGVGISLFPVLSDRPGTALFLYVGLFYTAIGTLITLELIRPHTRFRTIRWTMALISGLVFAQQGYRTWFYTAYPDGSLGPLDSLLYVSITLYAVSMAMGAIFFTTQHLQADLMRLVDKDPLTNIYNRRAFRRIMAALHCRVRQTDHTAALLAIDLDHFKTINDRFGHAAGDEVLVRVAETVQRHIRGDDTFARMGGEEFILVLEEMPSRDLRDMAQRLLKEIADLEFTFTAPPVHITASIGVVPYLEDYPTIDQAINAADTALYEAKRQGRNRIVIETIGHDEPRILQAI